MKDLCIIVHHLLENILSRLKVIKRPVKSLLTDWLFFGVVQILEIRVGETFIDRVTLVWVEHQHTR